MCAWRPESPLDVFCNSTSLYFVRQALTEPGAFLICLDWLDSTSQDPQASSSLELRSQVHVAKVGFYCMSTTGLNLGPHAHAACTLPTEPNPTLSNVPKHVYGGSHLSFSSGVLKRIKLSSS